MAGGEGSGVVSLIPARDSCGKTLFAVGLPLFCLQLGKLSHVNLFMVVEILMSKLLQVA